MLKDQLVPDTSWKNTLLTSKFLLSAGGQSAMFSCTYLLYTWRNSVTRKKPTHRCFLEARYDTCRLLSFCFVCRCPFLMFYVAFYQRQVGKPRALHAPHRHLLLNALERPSEEHVWLILDPACQAPKAVQLPPSYLTTAQVRYRHYPFSLEGGRSGLCPCGILASSHLHHIS